MFTSLPKARRPLLAVGCLAAGLFSLYVFTSVATGGYWYQTGTYGYHRLFPNFEELMRRNIDPEKIRAWADPILEGRNPRYQVGPKPVSIDPGDLPVWLRKSSLGDLPFSSDLVQNDEGAPVIQLVQGSSWGALGLSIGRKEYVTKGDDHTIVKRWIDGIYFFWE